MPKFVELDEQVTFEAQLQQEVAPVIVINTFKVLPTEVDQLLKAWSTHSLFMKQQPGFLWAQIHRGVGGSCVFVNYAVWESSAALRRALATPEFEAGLRDFPPSTVVLPHLYQKIAMPGICVDR